MARAQITLDPERRARQRASDLGVTLAEYVRSLAARDLGERRSACSAAALFDLGESGGSDIAKNSDSANNKDEMIAQAFAFKRCGSRR